VAGTPGVARLGRLPLPARGVNDPGKQGSAREKATISPCFYWYYLEDRLEARVGVEPTYKGFADPLEICWTAIQLTKSAIPVHPSVPFVIGLQSY